MRFIAGNSVTGKMTAVLNNIAFPSFGQEYSCATFEALEGPDEAYAQMEPVSDNLVPLLRTLFLKHDIEDLLGLSLLHRHFDLDTDVQVWDAALGKRTAKNGQDLVMVETFLDGASYTKPAARTNDLVPHTWKLVLGPDGKTIVPTPIEFIRADEHTPDFKSKALKISEDNLQPFLQELFVILRGVGLDSVLGINLVHRRDALRTKDSFLLREISDDDASIVKPFGSEHNDNSIPTSWMFDKKVPVAMPDGCCARTNMGHHGK